ncbi:MAG: phenylalanine--tRNA ligase subunit beta [Spirochaetaceae bacterium]|jgi:phenylalanyl-tRNA synthetase beta chain|nr:phenylalanine--tRNA ligase subunit beta [Spirochaetaceae bacterium]
MPKIEVNEEHFARLANLDMAKLSREAFEEILSCAKAELDEDSDKSLPLAERILKIELNDTNRPDLWGTAGCARQIRIYQGGEIPQYKFFATGDTVPMQPAHKVIVEKTVSKVRPFLSGFIARGKKIGGISDSMLKDMIQTQEKLAWNFGRKRRTISMGLYRIERIKWPIHYKGVDPDSVSFVPLNSAAYESDKELTLRQILKEHPKGREYAFIQEHEALHPLLVDATGGILSYPPIINSNDIGAVLVGDTDLFVELTGTDLNSVTLAASIVACDLSDNGFEIEPIEVEYEGEGSKISPFYFQQPVFCSLERIEKYLGKAISQEDCVKALRKMGVESEAVSGFERELMQSRKGAESLGVKAYPPPYRNDYLHAADVMEDVMIGCGLSSFAPERPRDFTVGRLSEITLYNRKVKQIMTGFGYQEMIYNYLGSKADFIDKMNTVNTDIIRIANPMSENYEYVRNSILPNLLASEALSGSAAYPHRIFETGKAARQDKNSADTTGTVTQNLLGFISAAEEVNFNTISAEIQTLCYYLSVEYTVEESQDKRFIPGRAANIMVDGACIGVYGEIHPEILSKWNITKPVAAAEIILDTLV